ncbi:hypothetical protein GT347_25430 [Xylophilus rhododendri]|uniref:Ice-binding protein C-terminal domain-containing protein n=1 Tax=Xylophilus rhododendri TaxID=2697032 RepID=A0A857JDJ5_9BURK|nr:PEP-CTERM sorting domain-containing protein [Xylophilus rhododendri]QHJ01033.1 hypothetical protein GT347_25430 [Xylophilus rhododendri]
MRFNTKLAALLLSTAATSSFAGVVLYTGRPEFSSQGSISYDSDFQSYGSSIVFATPATPLTLGDVTYPGPQNTIIGSLHPSSNLGKTKNVLVTGSFGALTGQINSVPKYTMLAFDGAVTSGVVNILISTNLASYGFSDVPFVDGSSGLTFEGFKTNSPNEYFVAFSLSTADPSQVPGITDITIGHAVMAAVPEPQEIAMLLAGLGLIGRSIRPRKSSAPKPT